MQCTRMPTRQQGITATPPPPHRTHAHTPAGASSGAVSTKSLSAPLLFRPPPAPPLPCRSGEVLGPYSSAFCAAICVATRRTCPKRPCAAKRREVSRMVRGCVCVWRSGWSWDKRRAMSAAGVRWFCVVAQWLCAAWKAQAECSLPTPAGDPARDRIRLGYLVVGLGGGDACTFCCARDVDGRRCAYHAEGGGGAI